MTGRILKLFLLCVSDGRTGIETRDGSVVFLAPNEGSFVRDKIYVSSLAELNERDGGREFRDTAHCVFCWPRGQKLDFLSRAKNGLVLRRTCTWRVAAPRWHSVLLCTLTSAM